MKSVPGVVCVVGQGYVGLPLAVRFARKRKTIGYDIDRRRIQRLRQGKSDIEDVPDRALKTPRLSFTSDPRAIQEADFVVVTVPTPVTRSKKPDLRPLRAASRTVGRHLKKGAVVVYESTVYPGVTEEVCGPILEKASGLRAGKDFKLAYSPERVNPGDRRHTLERIVKVVAAQDRATLNRVAALYSDIIRAGVYKAPSIRVAEAAKVIENTQRDINIGLVNELSLIFHRLGLDTRQVLAAARTKWNFLPFHPGLVGGHCIPVDPFYLVHCAKRAGHHPRVILAGRGVNDAMPLYVAGLALQGLRAAGHTPGKARALVLGATFKENIADCRNSGVEPLVKKLRAAGVRVDLHDPHLCKKRVFGAPNLARLPARAGYALVVLAVPHRVFASLTLARLRRLCTKAPVLVDVRGRFTARAAKRAGFAAYQAL